MITVPFVSMILNLSDFKYGFGILKMTQPWAKNLPNKASDKNEFSRISLDNNVRSCLKPCENYLPQYLSVHELKSEVLMLEVSFVLEW